MSAHGRSGFQRLQPRGGIAVDPRPEHDPFPCRIAGLQAPRFLREHFDEPVGDRVVNHQAFGCPADLALVEECTEGGGLDGRVEIGIVCIALCPPGPVSSVRVPGRSPAQGPYFAGRR